MLDRILKKTLSCINNTHTHTTMTTKENKKMLALAAVTAVTGFGLGIVTSYLLPKQKKEVTYV